MSSPSVLISSSSSYFIRNTCPKMSLCVVCVCVCGKEKEKLFFYLFFSFFLLLLSLPRYGQHVCQKLSLRERRQEISRLVKRGERGEKGVRALSIKTHFFFTSGKSVVCRRAPSEAPAVVIAARWMMAATTTVGGIKSLR